MQVRFVTISSFAKLCGINRESVYKRIKSGKLTTSPYCEHPLIDLEEYPHRDKWYYRIEKNRNDNYWQLFGGGFTNKIAQSLDVSYLINTYVK